MKEGVWGNIKVGRGVGGVWGGFTYLRGFLLPLAAQPSHHLLDWGSQPLALPSPCSLEEMQHHPAGLGPSGCSLMWKVLSV